jgi:beta-1,4-mannooligosaccharide phosphorylase
MGPDPSHHEVFRARPRGRRPRDSRAAPVIERILALVDHDVSTTMRSIDERFTTSHRDLHETFRQHAHLIASRIKHNANLSPDRVLLLSASFTHEYAIEGAALCNPSLVVGPGESGDGTGDARFVAHVLDPLPASFDDAALDARMTSLTADGPTRGGTEATICHVRAVSGSSYRVDFPTETLLSERVLWPHVSDERRGMEDARFVRFVDGGSVRYYGSYTAFDGTNVVQHIIETDDFATFLCGPMAGAAAAGKGLALFPRKVGGRYVALSRSDRETNAIAFSDDLYCWGTAESIQVPLHAWEVLQLGNCGSPIKTSEGWLVLTHGVGPMRTYALGALLLDLDDPRQVLAGSTEPILAPATTERGGYVPNVVYTCGHSPMATFSSSRMA